MWFGKGSQLRCQSGVSGEVAPGTVRVAIVSSGERLNRTASRAVTPHACPSGTHGRLMSALSVSREVDTVKRRSSVGPDPRQAVRPVGADGRAQGRRVPAAARPYAR